MGKWEFFASQINNSARLKSTIAANQNIQKAVHNSWNYSETFVFSFLITSINN